MVLFVGAGLSKRYLNLPNWKELIEEMLLLIEHDMPLDYYMQLTDKTFLDDDLVEVAEHVAELVHKWAWKKRAELDFPESYYHQDLPHTIFFKHLVSGIIRRRTVFSSEFEDEIKKLKAIRTNLIVTTNYDAFLENLFGFEVNVGKKISGAPDKQRVFKVHGCQEEPESIIILPSDYEKFSINHKYVFSKLLVHFVEDTCLFLGYSLSDPHMQELIFDASEASGKQVLGNVFLVDYGDEPRELQSDAHFELMRDRRLAKINTIKTTEFDWIYNIFADGEA